MQPREEDDFEGRERKTQGSAAAARRQAAESRHGDRKGQCGEDPRQSQDEDEAEGQEQQRRPGGSRPGRQADEAEECAEHESQAEARCVRPVRSVESESQPESCTQAQRLKIPRRQRGASPRAPRVWTAWATEQKR